WPQLRPAPFMTSRTAATKSHARPRARIVQALASWATPPETDTIWQLALDPSMFPGWLMPGSCLLCPALRTIEGRLPVHSVLQLRTAAFRMLYSSALQLNEEALKCRICRTCLSKPLRRIERESL